MTVTGVFAVRASLTPAVRAEMERINAVLRAPSVEGSSGEAEEVEQEDSPGREEQE
jgi:hypothetical protein